mmetsp:Transcript_83449/g.244661  ORF Transcript_83449/g.244661 Transcript_83449/m.244661 type:complete len:81 (-) Transcript_83449:15-257(-)
MNGTMQLKACAKAHAQKLMEKRWHGIMLRGKMGTPADWQDDEPKSKSHLVARDLHFPQVQRRIHAPLLFAGSRHQASGIR